MSDIDDVMAEVERQVAWQMSVEQWHFMRLGRPTVEVPDRPDLGAVLSVLGAGVLPLKGGEPA